MNKVNKKIMTGWSPKQLLLTLAFCALSVTAVNAGNVTLVTYYPAPNGIFDRISLSPQSSLLSPCSIGTLVLDGTTESLMYCRNNGSDVGVWGALSGVWIQSGDYIFPAAIDANPNIFVGIGTSTPDFKLTLDHDGGILAQGKFGQGRILSDLYSGASGPTMASFVWSPSRASLRIGAVNSLAYDAWDNSNTGDYSVGLGMNSITTGKASTFIGAGGGTLSGEYSTIAAMQGPCVITKNYSTIIGMGGTACSITGEGSVLEYMGEVTANHATVRGSGCNFANNVGVTVGGGAQNNMISPAYLCELGQGASTGLYSTIAGGYRNHSPGDYSAIGGGANNLASGAYSTIGGGVNNKASADYAVVGGGLDNTASGLFSFIGGGKMNMASGDYSVINGGLSNTASGLYSIVLGGNNNTAAGQASVVTGGSNNIALGNFSVVASGANNASLGNYTWTGGRFMKTDSDRTFVWGHSATPVTINSANNFIIYSGRMGIREIAPSGVLSIKGTGVEHFFAITSTNAAAVGNILMLKNNGYLGIGVANPLNPLQFGPQAGNAFLPTTGVWTTPSSRALKENIQPLEISRAIEAVANLRPVTYTYKLDETEHHVGFIAEDVPELLATQKRNSINPLNVAAVLTAVVKEQKKEIQEQENNLKILDNKLQKLEDKLRSQ